MRKLLHRSITLLLLFFVRGLVIAKESPFTTIYAANQISDLNFQAAHSTIIDLRLKDASATICGFSIDGKIILQNDQSMVRVLLEDSEGKMHLVLDYDMLWSDGDTIILSNYCEETFFLNDISPSRLICYIKNAQLNIDKVNYVFQNTSGLKKNASNSQLNDKRLQQVETIVKRINQYNKMHDKLWMAGITTLSLLDYESKKNALGILNDSCTTGGFEYYIGGVFEIDSSDSTPSPILANVDSPYVTDFDWRNRHGINWLTEPKNQGESGYCSAFACASVLEARTNLYFNQKFDLDLSEQDIVYNYARKSGRTPQSIYNIGMDPSMIFSYLIELGVIDEESEPFIDAPQTSIPTRPEGKECIKIQNSVQHNPMSIGENAIKDVIINNGPVVSGIYNCGMNHAMTLVGFHIIQAGDTLIRVNPVGEGGLDGNVLIVPENHDLIGETYWVFKDNYGTDMAKRQNGYFYIRFKSLNCMRPLLYSTSPIISRNYTDDDIVCEDKDGDGYYWWGIGPKPAHCPQWVPDVPDGDDADGTKGPMNTHGILLDLPSLQNDTIYIDENTEWSQPCFVYSHVVVRNKAVLKLTSDVTLYGNVDLILREGGSLHIDNCSLKNAKLEISPASNSVLTISNGGQLQFRNTTTQRFILPTGTCLNMEHGYIKFDD